MSEKKTMTERLRTMDPRAIYVMIFIATAIPILQPIGLPVPVSDTTKGVYDNIEKLPADSRVWYGIDFPVIAGAEIQPELEVTMRHLFTKPVKIMFVSFHQDGPMIYAKTIAKLGGQKKYGEDYVYMGFIPGYETGMAALASGFATAKDFQGTPIDSLPAVKGVRSVNDFAMAITCTSQTTVLDGYIRQIFTPYRDRVRGIILGIGLNYPQYSIYYPQQIVGILNGLKGAAEYESLSGFKGAAMSATDAFTIAQSILIVLVIVANIAFFAGKARRH